ncbi:CaiB/BaiF CoA transferase family protein [Cupriavidus necator]
MKGPLHGLRIVEMAGLGPVPFCGMVLADLGADVVRVERPNATSPVPEGANADADARFDITGRGRRSVSVDLRAPGGVQQVLGLVAHADVLLEGFRPGVMERLGLGPDICLALRPELIYGRMTGWGQEGPLAHAAGHDINYVALSGALHAIGRKGEPPPPPLNYIGDYGGGAMLLVVGVLAALHERSLSGKGQVIDSAMIDGAALLSSAFYAFKASGQWSKERGENFLDGGAHYYDTYACADGKYVAVGAIEPKFYQQLLQRCGIRQPLFERQNDRQAWPQLKLALADVFRTCPRDDWAQILEGTDACVAPVLDWDEAPRHPHNLARETFIEVSGVVQPAPAPRFSRTRCPRPQAPGETVSLDALVEEWSGKGSTASA